MAFGAAFELGLEEPQSVECITLPVRILRRDGETQSRIHLNADLTEEYAELMLEGTQFPPVRAGFDGTSYWLIDGFHRVAAVERLQQETIRVEVLRGTLTDAQWHSYRANAVHGLRRTPEDLRMVVKRALLHERASRLSNRELARHLHVSEKTIRRFRGNPSAACAADERVAMRNGREYKIHTENIGKTRHQIPKNEKEVEAAVDRRLVADLLVMDHQASPDVRRILTIFRNWTQRAPNALSVLQALEHLVAELKTNRQLVHQPRLANRK